MSIEQTVRDELRREAAAVPLPGREPDVAVSRARRRRHRRRATAASVAAVAVLAVVVQPIVRDGGEGGDLDIAGPASTGLSPTGPLDLDWQAVDGGLYDMRPAFSDEAGVIYALSTGPGARWTDHPDGDIPRALYRLGDDGTWEPVELGGDRPDATDLSGAGGLLYAVSTGPGTDGGTVARLSTSSDGGDTWSSEDVSPPAPPSDAVEWQREMTMEVESSSSTTLAVVNTRFTPDLEALFPEMADSARDLVVEFREEGLVLVEWVQLTSPEEPPADEDRTPAEHEAAEERAAAEQGASADPSDPPVTVTWPPPDEGAGAEEEASGDGSADPSDPPVTWSEGEGEDVRTIPWSDLGIDGLDDLTARHDLFRRAGDGWEPVDATGLGEVEAFELGVAGDRFVATGTVGDGTSFSVLTSPDGTSWTPVAESSDGRLVGVGPALVEIPWEGTTLRVSGDGGASWSDVDLTEVPGVEAGSGILEADGGPLGLALVVGDPATGGSSQVVVSGDLVDWTVTPLADVIGTDAASVYVQPVVGEDRIVVSATGEPTGTDEPPLTRTAIGTPVRG